MLKYKTLQRNVFTTSDYKKTTHTHTHKRKS